MRLGNTGHSARATVSSKALTWKYSSTSTVKRCSMAGRRQRSPPHKRTFRAEPSSRWHGSRVFSRAMSYRTNDVEVVATQLFPEAEALKDLVALLSESERDRASRFVFDRDRRRFIVGRARLRQLLAERLGVAPQSVELTYGACGKPALANSPRLDLRFNMSHCDDLAVYAFSHGTDVGIDVEAIRFLPDADRIAALFFSRRENETYGALAPHDN